MSIYDDKRTIERLNEQRRWLRERGIEHPKVIFGCAIDKPPVRIPLDQYWVQRTLLKKERKK